MSLPSNKVFDKPFVLSMGPQRAGTSWLDRYLRVRGDVCVPAEVKEIFFFDRHYHRGSQFYFDHFQPAPEHKIIMEVSTTSFDVPDAPRHVHEVFGKDLTMLCPLRHPVARSYSLYLHYKRYGMVSGSLQEAYRENPQIIESSRYTDHLENWYEYYGPEHIHLLFQEELEADFERYVAQVCDVLKLDAVDIPPDVTGRYNATTRAPSELLAKCAQYGADFLRKHNMYSVVNVAKLLGLKSLVFGSGGEGGLDCLDKTKIDDLKWLNDQLGHEVEKFEALAGPVQIWRDLDLAA